MTYIYNTFICIIIIEQKLREAKVDQHNEFPAAIALNKCRSTLADNIQGSLIFFANRAESLHILTAAEKQIITDASGKHDVLSTQKLMDVVGNLIAKDENVFDRFVNILPELGGSMIAKAKDLSKYS